MSKKKSRKNKKYVPKSTTLNAVLGKVTQLMYKYCAEHYPMPEEGAKVSDRTFCMEFFDYSSLPLTEEHVRKIKDILNADPKDTQGVAQYVGTEFETYICMTINTFAQPIMKEAVKKLTSIEQVITTTAHMDTLAYDWVCNNFSCDLDTKEIIRSIMEADNPYCLLTKKEQVFNMSNKKWEDVSSHTRPISELHYHRLTDPATSNFFKELGATEYISRDDEGFLKKLISTAPDRATRSVYLIERDLYEYFANADWMGEIRSES